MAKEKSEIKDKKVNKEPVKIVEKPKLEVAFEQSSSPVISIEKYFMKRNILAAHRGAMRAFTRTKMATIEQWDKIFKEY